MSKVKFKDIDKRILCIPDVHLPYHDQRAFDLVRGVAAHLRPDIIIAMGDWWDFWKISRYGKKRAYERQSFDEEFLAGEEALSDFTAPSKYFICGNHDARLEAYIDEQAGDLAQTLGRLKIGVEHSVRAAGWKYTPYQKTLKLGKVYYTHDFGRAGKYAIHQNAADIQHSFVIGHTHRYDICIEGDPVGSNKLAASFGWLGDFEAIDYRHRMRALREWAHGFGIGYMTRSGVTWWTGIPIINGTCCIEGRVFRV